MNTFSNSDDAPLELHVGVTSLYFHAKPNGSIGHGTSLAWFVKDNLQETDYDWKAARWLPTYRYSTYNAKTETAYLPRYVLPKLEEFLQRRQVPYKIIDEPPVTPRSVKISMKKNFEPKQEQLEIIQFLSDPDIQYKPLSARVGCGKFCRNSSLIKVPGGWKRMGDIRVGDIVTARDGTPTRVIGVYPQGVQPLWTVTFRDGRAVEVGAEHLWAVYSADRWRRTGQPEVMDTMQLKHELARPGNHKKVHIPLIDSEQGPEKDLPLDPYVLGAYLGDGSYTTAHGCISFTTDTWIMDKMRERLPGCIIKSKPYRAWSVDYCSSGLLSRCNDAGRRIYAIFNELGLKDKRAWEKFIPEEYMTGSHQQRLDLVHGLLDTDGYISDPKKCPGRNGTFTSKTGVPEFCTTSEKLASQFQELIWSLGGICTKRVKLPVYTYKGETHYGRPAWIIHFRVKHVDEFFSLPRKKNRTGHSNQYTQWLRLGVLAVTPSIHKEECTCIAVEHPEHLYVMEQYIATHNTVMSMAAISNLGYTTMIVLGLLIPQWFKALKQFTTLSTSDIYVIQGFDSLKKLWEMHKEGYHPKVIIFATRTLSLYANQANENYVELPDYQEFQKQFGIGVKIIDEVHLGFNANVLVDLNSNIKHNIYLSATYKRTNRSGRRIFNTVFPPEVIYGDGVKKKYTVVNVVSYSTGMGASSETKFRSPKGYNHARYEAYILKIRELKYEYMNRMIPTVLRLYYLDYHKPEYRALILCQTKKFAKEVHAAIKKFLASYEFTDATGKPCNRSLGLFFSGLSPQSELSKDIIVSTIKSCGTGMDLKGLITCINTVSYSSPVLTIQVAGRLREIPDVETQFVDLYCRDIPTHRRHKEARLQEYSKMAKRIMSHDL